MNKIDFKEIINKEEWQKFVKSFTFFTFLQSWEWGEMQKLDGEKIFRLGGYLNNELVISALVILIKAKRGTFLLVPHGPLTKDNKYFKEFTNYLIKLGKEEKVDFLRLSSTLLNTKENASLLEKLGYRFAPMHVHAETTWLLDLSKPDKELLAGMRKTTRYIILYSYK